MEDDNAGDDARPASEPAGEQNGIETEAEAQAAATVEGELSDLDRLARERDEMRVMAQRLQADFENYRKRVQRDQADLVSRATEKLLEELLPVLDSFELAGAQLDTDEHDLDKVRGGLLAAIRQLDDVLVKAGLEAVREAGVAFDPMVHEAVMHEDNGSGEPVVADVLRTGYLLNGRVLRAAMVKVAQ